MSEKSIPRLVQGNEAIALGAIHAGCRFYGGYPITPSTEIAEEMSRLLPHIGGSYVQMEDEISSIAAVIGASLTGQKSMTATSGPGFSLMQENLGYAAMAEIPLVLVNVQRGGPSTGLPTDPAQGDMMQARWGTHGEHSIIALVPSTVAECFTLTVEAFNLSERYRTPVIILSDALIGHMRENIRLDQLLKAKVIERPQPWMSPEDYRPFASTERTVVPLAPIGTEYRYRVTGLVHDMSGSPKTGDKRTIEDTGRRLRSKIYDYREEITRVEMTAMDDAEVAIFAYGSVARSAYEAVMWARERGHKVGMVRPITIWPFPTLQMREVADQVHSIVVPEMNIKQIAWETRAAIEGRANVVSMNRIDGTLIAPGEIISSLRDVLRAKGGAA